MPAILALLGQALAVIGEILGIAQAIRALMAPLVKEHLPYQVESTVTATSLNVASPTYGLSAIHSDLTAGIADILAAFDGVAQSGSAPTWWVDPPTPPDTDSIAYAVWAWASSGFYLDGSSYNLNMAQVVDVAASRALLDQAWYGVPLPECPFYAMCVGRTDFYGPSGWSWGFLVTTGRPAWPDWTQVLSTDTAYTFLARTQPAYNWSLVGPGGYNDAHTAWKDLGNPPISSTWIRSNFTELDMRQLSSLVVIPPVELEVAPVWPGAAQVTWGDQVALSDGLTIEGPLDGLIVHITSHPDHAGRYDFGERISWTHAGGVIFATDNGYYEFSQPLGLDLNLLVPRTMEQADHAIIRLGPGFGGTVTPWART